MKNVLDRTHHRLINGDARDLSFLNDESVHLVVTSPPYWNLKRYQENPDQLGHIEEYEIFLPVDRGELLKKVIEVVKENSVPLVFVISPI